MNSKTPKILTLRRRKNPLTWSHTRNRMQTPKIKITCKMWDACKEFQHHVGPSRTEKGRVWIHCALSSNSLKSWHFRSFSCWTRFVSFQPPKRHVSNRRTKLHWSIFRPMWIPEKLNCIAHVPKWKICPSKLVSLSFPETNFWFWGPTVLNPPTFFFKIMKTNFNVAGFEVLTAVRTPSNSEANRRFGGT
jgi:hypothetical protein